MNTELSVIEKLPTASHLYSIIWLHGLGADGHDFEGIAAELHCQMGAHIHFVFPNAPIQPVTINGGMSMRSWYDILDTTLERKADKEGIYKSAQQIEYLINKEIDKGIPSTRILLAGFSQGGVIALHVGLRFLQPLAGVIALSAYLPTLAELEAEASPANTGMPIFMGHGILDSLIAIESGKAVCNNLQQLGYATQWHDYVMEHSVCIEEIEHISAFINGIFKLTSA